MAHDKDNRNILCEDPRIAALDLINAYSCTHDKKSKYELERTIKQALIGLKEKITSGPHIELYTDGSYDPKTGLAGIGLLIIKDPSKAPNESPNAAFGKAVKAKSALEAEIYALSIGLSYMMDTYSDSSAALIRYDCSGTAACMNGVEQLVRLGSPYTNLRSAARRLRKQGMNVVFEHVKAHEDDENNALCDLIARYYSKARLPARQMTQVRKALGKPAL